MSTYRGKRRRSKKRQRQILIARIIFGAAVVGLIALLVLAGRAVGSLLSGGEKAESLSVPEALVEEPAPTPESTLSPEQEQAAQEAVWQENADSFFNWLKTQNGFENLDLHQQQNFPYLICVNRDASCVTVYTVGENGEYSVPYAAMVCSGGSDTPTGFFNTPINYSWRLLAGPCYGQYATRIWDCYLFHSVPYYSQHKDDLEYDEFNLLGTPASLGCIRLMVCDVKWIYDNCDIGTPVLIYDDASNPGPMGKPGTITVDPADEARRGWDPTDPDPANPYGTQYRDGTTIRSAKAKADWEAAWAENGNHADSLTPTDLQGWSTDSKIEGTRG